MKQALRTARFPLLGPITWIVAAIQYFVVQFIVASDWRLPYSLAHNTISDLGNSSCGTYSGNYVCSPLHTVMNVSFVVLGAGMIIGSIGIYRILRKSRASQIGFSYMAIAGIGTIIVGLFPENTTSGLHTYGAALPFFVGNLGLVVLGFGLNLPKALRVYTIASGLLALVALFCFVNHSYFGVGDGGIERFTAYPQTVWLLVFGVWMFAARWTLFLRSKQH